MLNNKRLILRSLAIFGIVGFLAACGGGDGDDGPVFDPTVAPKNAQVVSGDGFTTDVSNTISWTDDPTATEYVVYWDTVPGVTVNSQQVVPTDTGLNYFVHSGTEVFAGQTYYYRVVAVSGSETSVISDEVSGIPQESEVGTNLNDIVWNGIATLVAVGDSGVILHSPNGTTSEWDPATVNPTSESLAGVTWEDVNNQFLAVGASGRILTSSDGDNWTSQVSGVSTDLEDVAYTGNEYIVVGKNGTILKSDDFIGTTWTVKLTPSTVTNITLEGVAVGYDDVGNIVLVVTGTNGTILTSNDVGESWTEVAKITNNDLNDVTWNGTRFGVVGSNDTILTSPDGVTWTEHVPGTPNITFVGTVQWDSSLPVDPILAAVGSAGTFAVSPDSVSGYSVPTGTNEQLSSITWVDDGINPYFIMVGHDGTVLTNQQ